jgi:hypothetical protein
MYTLNLDIGSWILIDIPENCEHVSREDASTFFGNNLVALFDIYDALSVQRVDIKSYMDDRR